MNNYIHIEDVAELVTKGTTPSTVGYEFVDSGINYIKAESIGEIGNINTSKIAFITDEANEALRRSKIEPNDILLTIAGSIGRSTVATEDLLPANTNQAVAIIRPKKNVNPYFIHYSIQGFKNQSKMKKLSGLSVQANINLEQVKGLKLKDLSRKEQDEIVGKIKCYDDKIKLNLKLIAELEEYSQLLFHKWLVRINFSDEINRSSNRNGNQITASDFCNRVTDGTHDTPKPVDEGFQLITSKHILNGKLDTREAYFISKNDYIEINKRSKVEQWDILFSMIGSVGEVYLEANPSPKYAIKNLGLFKMNGDKKKAIKLYYYLKSPYFQKKLSFLLSGSIQSFVPLQFLRSIKLSQKFVDTDNNYKKIFEPIGSVVDKVVHLRKENEILEETRNLLIKKLFI